MTERKEAEASLRRERDRARQYLDVADVILLAVDLDGRITRINRYACALLGWTEDELLGRDWIETYLPARVRDTLRQTFHSLLGGDLSVVENPVVTKSGEERLIEWHNTVLRDDAGRVIGTFSSGTDITERQRAVEALRTAEERMRFALESANVGIWDMDYATGVLRWSEILEAQYGLRPGTFGGTFEAFVEAFIPTIASTVLEDAWKRHEVRRRFLDTASGDLARRHGAVAEQRGPYPPRRAWRTACAVSAFPWTSPSAARWRSSISRRRRWKPSAGWPAAWRTTSTTC